jgi:hypothetical protein
VTYWIRRIHTYLGLLNFSLLFVFGIAGLVVTFEAPDIFHQERGPSVEFRDFSPPLSASDREVGQLIAQAINPPHAGPPVVRRNATNQLVTDFYSVNGLVRVTALPGEHRIQVQTFRNSIWRFMDNAHATTIAETKRDGAVLAWAWYIEFSIWSLIAMSLGGLWLGISSRWNYRWTRVSLAAGCLVFVTLYWLEK